MTIKIKLVVKNIFDNRKILTNFIYLLSEFIENKAFWLKFDINKAD